MPSVQGSVDIVSSCRCAGLCGTAGSHDTEDAGACTLRARGAATAAATQGVGTGTSTLFSVKNYHG